MKKIRTTVILSEELKKALDKEREKGSKRHVRINVSAICEQALWDYLKKGKK